QSRHSAKRISSDDDIDGDNDLLLGQQAIFTEQSGLNMISDFQGVLSHNQCIFNTNGDEVNFTDAVPYIRTSAHPMEDVTSIVFWHKENAVSVQNQPLETRKCLMIGINVNEALNTNDNFDITLDIYWNVLCGLNALEVM
ncbi:13165_t:CDS:2, partial [Dentiscutata heterogama]